MKHPSLPLLAMILVVSATACGSHEFEPPDRGERVREASAKYAPSLFDSITWDDEASRDSAGNEIYVDKCRKCHGSMGEGSTEYDQEQGFPAPSLIKPDWRLATPDSLHRVIFVGHEVGMPIYGDGGITPRQIDAVTGYILNTLRPEALQRPGS